MATFGERLKLLRNDKNLTQRKMGDIINSTEKCYQNYETNRSTPHFHTLISLADFFDVSLDYLVGRSDIKERR